MKNFKIGDEIDLEVYPEEHCELCSDIIHNHIDCPVCKTEDASTDIYDCMSDGYYEELTCENCGTVFKKISKYWYSDCKVVIKTLGNITC